MFGRSIHLTLPRRISVYSLVFGLAAVAWLFGCFVYVSHAVVRTTLLSSRLAPIDRHASRVKIAMQKGDADVQTVVEQIASENSLAYCAVENSDGLVAAHSARRDLGKAYRPPDGSPVSWGDLSGTRYAAGAQIVSEFTMLLRRGGKMLGTLRVGIQEPSLWSVFEVASNYLPVATLAPLALIGLGAFVVYRMLRPVAAVETQLKVAAVAPTAADATLRQVDSRSPEALGWNRVVEWLKTSNETCGLTQRLSEAVQAIHKDRSDDVLNSLSEGIAVTDSEGQITYSNSAMVSLLGGQAEGGTLNGLSPIDLLGLVSEEEPSPLLDPRGEGRTVVDELTQPLGEGERILRISRQPIRSSDRTATGHVWTVRDITQQKLAERMRDQFLDSATHELRTPLANIRAYAETLACSDVMDVESQKQFCNTINAEAARLARFIDDLLSISSMEVGSLSLAVTNVDLERLLRDVIEKVQPQIDQKHQIFKALLPEKYPRVKLDKDKISVALINLLGNAVKYTPEAGQIALRVRVEPQYLLIDVEDTGVGISADELPRVFDKFFRSQDAQVQEVTGTGLGLSMTQEIVRLHGGELSVQSEIGKGSTFTISLPLERERK